MMDQGWALRDSSLETGALHSAIYAGPAYDEALSRLLFTVEQQRHCGLLFGPAGSGKSVLLGQFARIVRRASRELAFVDVHQRSTSEVLWELSGELGLSPHYDDSTFILWRRVLDHFLANRGVEPPTVVVLDHADQGADETASLVTRLVHLASQGQGLTVIVAIRRRNLVDLPEPWRDATDLRIELAGYDRHESGDFVRAVFQSPEDDLPTFEEPAIDRLHSLSHGLPRMLSQLGELALLAALASDERTITERTVRAAAADLQLSNVPETNGTPAWSSSRPWAEI